MTERPAQLPPRIVGAVVVACLAPILLMFCGVRLEAGDESRGVALHGLLEWTAFGVALVSVHFAYLQYSLNGDASTPIIGSALFFSGTMDAFHALATDRLIQTVADNRDFIPFTWAISRMVNAALIVGGASLFLRRPLPGRSPTRRGLRFIGLVSLLFGLCAYAIIHFSAVAPQLPQALFADRTVPRPYDAIPLVLFLLGGGIVLPRFYRNHPSLFSHGLMLSVLPQIAAQCHAAFGSSDLFDSHANAASILKIIAYQVPFYGMTLDYRRAYRAEASLRAAEEKLRLAREVQRGVLPERPPAVPGFDVAGRSDPADVMGGDFFDYIPVSGGCWGVVLADVSGHDVGASALLAQTRAYLRALCRETDDPATLLTEANRFVCDDVRDTRFCELFFVRIDPHRRSARYAGAGHNAWMFRDDDAPLEWQTTGPALGIVSGSSYGSGDETALPTGAVLIIASDGIVEAESLGGTPFGVERLWLEVRRHRDQSAAKILEAVFAAVDEHTGAAPQGDDRTLVVIKAT